MTASRHRAGRYQIALAILRANHREEFDAILADLRAMQADGLAVAPAAPGAPPRAGAVGGTAEPAARPQQPAVPLATNPGARNAGAVN